MSFGQRQIGHVDAFLDYSEEVKTISYRSDADSILFTMDLFSIEERFRHYTGMVSGEISGEYNLTYSKYGLEGYIKIDDHDAFEVYSEGNNVYAIETDFHDFVAAMNEGHERYAEDYEKWLNGEVDVKPAADVPVYESNPGAEFVIYLDFDGERVEESRWNGQGGVPEVYDAAPRGFTTAQMEGIVEVIAQDYLPFNVNVTTVRSSFEDTDIEKRQMVIFTGSAFFPAGGIAFIGEFGSDTYDDPCFVFDVILGLASNGGSHEAGHTLGLNHDGGTPTGYYEGHNDWGPIMGIVFDNKLGQWSKGEYGVANNTEDDIAVILSNGISLKADDHGDDVYTATPLTFDGEQVVSNLGGLIEQQSDVDLFSFTTAGGAIDISVTPISSETNLNVKIDLLDESGNVILSAEEDHPDFFARLENTVAGGTYYLRIDGAGWGNPLTDGYTDYGSLGDYEITGSVAQVLNAISREADANTSELLYTTDLKGRVVTETTSGHILLEFYSDGTVLKVLRQ